MLFPACDSFNDYQQDVDKLRIVGVKADYSDIIVTIGPGNIPSFDPALVNVETLFADPKGKGRAVKEYLSACPPMALDVSVNFDCDGDNGLPLVNNVFNPYAYLQWVVEKQKEGTLPSWVTGDLSQITQQFATGVPILLWYRVTADEETAVALKRIIFKTNPGHNGNPVVSSATIENVPLAGGLLVRADRVFHFYAKADASSLDTTTEYPLFVWYATEGHFTDLYTDTSHSVNNWRSPKLEEGETSRRVDFYIMLEDLKGGLGWFAVTGIYIVP